MFYGRRGRIFRTVGRWVIPVWLGVTGVVWGEEAVPAARREGRVFRIEREEAGYRRVYYAALRFRAEEGELTVWNRGADPQINPVFRVRFVLPPARDSVGWCYEGRIFRNLNPGKPVRIESCTKLDDYRSGLDFVLREADRESRFRFDGRNK